jgi:hypothetical protein
MVLNKLATMSTSPKSVKPGALCEGDAERNLLTWAENEGVKSKIDAAGQFHGMRFSFSLEWSFSSTNVFFHFIFF